MATDPVLEMRDLLTDVESLQTSMLLTIKGNTEDHGKWVTFKRVAIEYNNISKRYSQLTGSPLDLYNTEAFKDFYNTIWPFQKSVFEQVYQDVLKLHGRIKNRLTPGTPPTGFDALLHPDIRAASIAHYQAGDYRNAVLDGIIAISDKIRERTGLDLDGDRLCGAAFSVNNPVLVFSNVDTDSGRNDQVGFMEIIKGIYKGVRNPKAHSLEHDLDHTKAGQYLVMLSLIMRRVTEATLVTPSASPPAEN
jgi:uncharacterized protein (TIGR02391 family)